MVFFVVLEIFYVPINYGVTSCLLFSILRNIEYDAHQVIQTVIFVSLLLIPNCRLTLQKYGL